MIADSSELARCTVLVYNTDNAESGEFARWYASQYGIPAANLYGYAMGAAQLWAFPGGGGTMAERADARFASFLVPLRDLVVSVGARAVLLCYGCPIAISLLNTARTAEASIYGYSLFHLLAWVKKAVEVGLAAGGIEPTISGAGNAFWSVAGQQFGSISPKPAGLTASQGLGLLGYTAYPLYRTTVENDPAGGDVEPYGGYYTLASTEPAFENYDVLASGFAGYTPWTGTPAVDGLARSKTIVEKSLALQRLRANTVARKVLVGISGLATSFNKIKEQAMLARRFIDYGFDVTFWGSREDYHTNAETQYWYNAMLTWDDALNITGTNWTVTAMNDTGLTQSNPNDVTWHYGVGSGFQNDKQVEWGSAKWMPAAGGVFAGGASYDQKWAVQMMSDNSVSSICHVDTGAGGWHQGANHIEYCNAWHVLLDGFSLCEAAWMMRHYTFVAIGDPLSRPFQRADDWWSTDANPYLHSW